jgi:hypothetical protein
MWSGRRPAAPVPERRGEAFSPGGGHGGEVEEEGVAGAAGEGGEGGAEGVVVADEQGVVLWDAWVEPATVLEEEMASSAESGRARSAECLRHCESEKVIALACSGSTCGSARR